MDGLKEELLVRLCASYGGSGFIFSNNKHVFLATIVHDC